MNFHSSVSQTPDVANAYLDGLQALRRMHKPHVAAENTRRITGSVDVDTALKSRCPNDARWDYAIGHRPKNLKHGEEMVYWVEIHPASSSHVNEVLAKLRWLTAWLDNHAPQLKLLRREFVWLSSGKTSLTLSAPQLKKLALSGLQHKGRKLTIPEKVAS